jgi:hypothetical protein
MEFSWSFLLSPARDSLGLGFNRIIYSFLGIALFWLFELCWYYAYRIQVFHMELAKYHFGFFFPTDAVEVCTIVGPEFIGDGR